ncbi:uncharacterized protein LOC144954843 [Lampetra fluviatilis]
MVARTARRRQQLRPVHGEAPAAVKTTRRTTTQATQTTRRGGKAEVVALETGPWRVVLLVTRHPQQQQQQQQQGELLCSAHAGAGPPPPRRHHRPSSGTRPVAPRFCHARDGAVRGRRPEPVVVVVGFFRGASLPPKIDRRCRQQLRPIHTATLSGSAATAGGSGNAAVVLAGALLIGVHVLLSCGLLGTQVRCRKRPGGRPRSPALSAPEGARQSHVAHHAPRDLPQPLPDWGPPPRALPPPPADGRASRSLFVRPPIGPRDGAAPGASSPGASSTPSPSPGRRSPRWRPPGRLPPACRAAGHAPPAAAAAASPLKTSPSPSSSSLKTPSPASACAGATLHAAGRTALFCTRRRRSSSPSSPSSPSPPTPAVEWDPPRPAASLPRPRWRRLRAAPGAGRCRRLLPGRPATAACARSRCYFSGACWRRGCGTTIHRCTTRQRRRRWRCWWWWERRGAGGRPPDWRPRTTLLRPPRQHRH